MPTQKSEIRDWLNRGKDKGATHMIVATDTFDWSDYPVFVMPDEDARECVAKQEKIMEVYDLSLDFETQLNEYRALHY